jgi:DhnA family fructose-bisphosphate aldolase class Ia
MATTSTTVRLRPFAPEEALPLDVFAEITEIRVDRPRWIEKEAKRRKRPRRLTRDGRLVLLAIDHPARGVTAIRGDALAMSDRHQYLARTRRVLDDPGLDGVVATADLIEELLILSHLERKATGRGFLDGRVLVGTMNRGGVAGTAFEMDDAFTGMGAARLAELRCQGGKMMYRLEPQEPASGRTILACAQALNDLRREGLAAFLEPLAVARGASGGYEPAKDAATLARQCGIAAGLGDSSAHLWLKLPYGEGFARVARATTLPILLLGGPARESPAETLRDFASGLAAGPNVRGAIIGRNLLFPGDADPLPMCRALTALVHGGAGLRGALEVLEAAGPEPPPPPRARKRERGRK